MNDVLLALLIFALRVTDVSIGTFRIIMLVRRRHLIAGAIGFFESALWVLAAGLVLTNLDSPIKVIGYAGGFAAGTVVGAVIERWIAMGRQVLRIITATGSPGVADELRALGYGVTVVNAEGLAGDVKIAFTVIPRRDAPRVLDVVRRVNPEAFVTMEDVDIPDLAARRRTLLRV